MMETTQKDVEDVAVELGEFRPQLTCEYHTTDEMSQTLVKCDELAVYRIPATNLGIERHSCDRHLLPMLQHLRDVINVLHDAPGVSVISLRDSGGK